MTSELVAGGNRALPASALTIRVPGPFDVSALITGEEGRTSGDGDFVFFNQPSAHGWRATPSPWTRHGCDRVRGGSRWSQPGLRRWRRCPPRS
ncbi:hypothetical protein [Streptomyces triculaminicus]|uniref:hypothetical protein n=1 Tax=Streptomyces triculaminicus TaxID=2816232 RepID=UPI0037D910A3